MSVSCGICYAGAAGIEQLVCGPCGHSMCRRCAVTWLRSELDDTVHGRNGCACPVCRDNGTTCGMYPAGWIVREMVELLVSCPKPTSNRIGATSAAEATTVAAAHPKPSKKAGTKRTREEFEQSSDDASLDGDSAMLLDFLSLNRRACKCGPGGCMGLGKDALEVYDRLYALHAMNTAMDSASVSETGASSSSGAGAGASSTRAVRGNNAAGVPAHHHLDKAVQCKNAGCRAVFVVPRPGHTGAMDSGAASAGAGAGASSSSASSSASSPAPAGLGTYRMCPHCDAALCIDCDQPWEWSSSGATAVSHGGRCCGDFAVAVQQVIRAMSILPPGHKRCPGCGVDTYRPRGDQCHNVICDKCKTAFCFVCLRKDNTANHGCPAYCEDCCDCVPMTETPEAKTARLTAHSAALKAKMAEGWHGPAMIAQTPVPATVSFGKMLGAALANKDQCTLASLLCSPAARAYVADHKEDLAFLAKIPGIIRLLCQDSDVPDAAPHAGCAPAGSRALSFSRGSAQRGADTARRPSGSNRRAGTGTVMRSQGPSTPPSAAAGMNVRAAMAVWGSLQHPSTDIGVTCRTGSRADSTAVGCLIATLMERKEARLVEDLLDALQYCPWFVYQHRLLDGFAPSLVERGHRHGASRHTRSQLGAAAGEGASSAAAASSADVEAPARPPHSALATALLILHVALNTLGAVHRHVDRLVAAGADLKVAANWRFAVDATGGQTILHVLASARFDTSTQYLKECCTRLVTGLLDAGGDPGLAGTADMPHPPFNLAIVDWTDANGVNRDVIKLLATHPAIVRAGPDSTGRSPFAQMCNMYPNIRYLKSTEAVWRCPTDPDIVMAMVKAGADVLQLDDSSSTPLLSFLKSIFAGSRAPLDEVNFHVGETPAAIEAVQAFVDAGANVMKASSYGGIYRSPFSYAVAGTSRRWKQIPLLLARAPTMNPHGLLRDVSSTPLQLACEARNVDVALELLKHGADPNDVTGSANLQPPLLVVLDHLGSNCLVQAFDWLQDGLRLAAALIDAGADVNARSTGASGRTVFASLVALLGQKSGMNEAIEHVAYRVACHSKFRPDDHVEASGKGTALHAICSAPLSSARICPAST